MSVARLVDSALENVTIQQLRLKSETRTLDGDVTLTVDSPTLQFIDPNGARTLTLPAEADSVGLVFVISNEAGGSEILTIADDAAATIVTPTQNEAAIVFCDGTTWSGIVGATS